MLAGDERRIGRGVLAILLLLGGMLVLGFLVSQGAALVDQQLGRTNPTWGGTDVTPVYQAGNMLSLALLVPWSAIIHRWLYRVPAASLHSVSSRFRFEVLGRAVVLVTPLWVLVVVTSTAVPDQVPWSPADLVTMFALTIILTPLQSAGEEYGLRGLVFRVAGSWSRGPRAGLVVGVLVSSVVFVGLHLSSDPWRNLYYLAPAVSFAIITWRTGGLEVAVAVHALNNTLLFLFDTLMHSDFPSLQERSTGGDALLLVPTGALAVITAAVWWRTRRSGPLLTPGPGSFSRAGRPPRGRRSLAPAGRWRRPGRGPHPGCAAGRC
ncbi:Membrane protease YdiL, CAAX protease family [Auraticoccus monumenti]|uniref:Membrane protease YdiL, CAAX protease family n=1 Tax=Auraticoccus monumenti TaxID=675864 RepID=A0A1G6WMT5_9ACTN|nr:Membrane protease YdiL, CAAX protease family [Auraticoccus monumenti]